MAVVPGDRAVGEHGRAPRFTGTFGGAKAVELFSSAPEGAPQPVIPEVLDLLGPPAEPR